MRRKIIIVAHNLRSAHNVGSLLRTCEGLGVSEVIFSGYTPYPSKANDPRLPHLARKLDKQIDKTALGAQKFQKWQTQADINTVLQNLSARGYTVCALEQSKKSIRLEEFKAPDKVALIIGSEVGGIDEEVLSSVKYILEIPMLGKKESFNVVQAAAMALYSFRFGSG